MRKILPLILLSTLTSGCSYLGYYKHVKAERAPPEESSKVQLPTSSEGGTHLTGPMLSALGVAMNEFLPPGQTFKTNDPDKRVALCLSLWSTYETLVQQSSDDLFFVTFIPDIKRCGLQDIILDGGAVYAIDGKGRILDVR